MTRRTPIRQSAVFIFARSESTTSGSLSKSPMPEAFVRNISDGPQPNVSPQLGIQSPDCTIFHKLPGLLHCRRTGQRRPSQNLGLNTSWFPGNATISICTGAGSIGSGRPTPPTRIFPLDQLGIQFARLGIIQRSEKYPISHPEKQTESDIRAVRRRATAPAFLVSGGGGQVKVLLKSRQLIGSTVDLQFQSESFRRGSSWGRRV